MKEGSPLFFLIMVSLTFLTINRTTTSLYLIPNPTYTSIQLPV